MVTKDIIIYDGVCKMCNAFFRWVHKNDEKDIFMFTNFQSDYTSTKMDILKDSNSIAVILANGTVLRKINAIKHILKETKKFIIISLILKIVPNFIANFLYDIIADLRYVVFGRYDSCPILDEKYKSKFLN
tara:strand:+ start:276 stop:668 length:393 start_codon:yes stop_codon:yes gene_type:complete